MSVVVGTTLINTIPLALWGRGVVQPWAVDLFVNLHVPQPTDSLAQFQICTLPGYSQFELNPLEWEGTSENPTIASYQYPLLTFNFDAYTGKQVTIFGYVVSSAPYGSTGVSAAFFYGELFPAPYPVPPAGGSLPLILLFTAEQCLNP